MKKYVTNPTIKNAILRKATELFYDNGLNDTTIDNIAKQLDISKGLISYHYKTKYILAKNVYDNYRNSFHRKMSEKYAVFTDTLHDDLLHQNTAVIVRSLLRLYRDDEKACRFFKEILPDIICNNPEDYYPFYDYHYTKYNLDIDIKQGEDILLQNASVGATAMIKLAYFNGKLETSFEYFEDYCVKTPFIFMKIPNDLIEEIVQNSKTDIERLNLRYLPYFDIE